MEYLGGGSALDLVGFNIYGIVYVFVCFSLYPHNIWI